MKKFVRPEMHLVKLENLPKGINLAELSDEELSAVLAQGNFARGKVCYQASGEYELREIGGEIVLVPVGAQAVHGMITFNETGVFLWKQLEKRKTAADLAQAMKQEFNAPMDKIEEDVQRFLERAQKKKMIYAC